MNLYVDVDDTLILWTFHKGLPNAKLIAAIIKWRVEHPASDYIFIWSGGGADYARGWCIKYLGQKLWNAVFDKYKQLNDGVFAPRVGDICIDDQQIKTDAIVMTPEKFIEFMA